MKEKKSHGNATKPNVKVLIDSSQDENISILVPSVALSCFIAQHLRVVLKRPLAPKI